MAKDITKKMTKEMGLRIKLIREDLNMSKTRLAECLGISSQYLGIIEHGGSTLRIDKLQKLCEISNYSADYILFGTENRLSSAAKKSLSDFSDEQIRAGIEVLSTFASFIRAG